MKKKIIEELKKEEEIEVKTLNDITRIWIPDFDCVRDLEKVAKENENNPIIFSYGLTKEINKLYQHYAIIWIRACQKFILRHKKERNILFDNRTHTVDEWIAIIKDRKYFFNISEDYLK